MQSHDNLQNFLNVIQVATGSTDASKRPQAQQQIMQYLYSNPTQLFLDCSIIIKTPSFKPTDRQLGGTVASRLLNRLNDSTQKPRFFWDEVDPKTKTQIKQNLLAVLIEQDSNVMRAAAQTIAVIASIQLTRNEWHDIVDILVKHCTHTDPFIKRASITTLGYTCEQIKALGKSIDERLSEQILGAIIVSAREGGEFAKSSLKALEDCMQFVEPLLHKPNYRDTVFSVFVDNFRNQQEEDTTYQALFQFAKYAAPYLTSYQDSLKQLAEAHLGRRDEIADLNLQLWQTIGNDYSQKMSIEKDRVGDQNIGGNLLQNVSSDLLQQIMKCLLISNKNEEQENAALRISASSALEAFVKVCDITVVDYIARSASQILNSTDPYHQQATVLLFSTICEYPDKQYVQEMFKNGFDHLFGLLMNNNKIVVSNSLIGFLRLSEALPEVFLTHQSISEIVDTIMSFMIVSDPKVRENSISILVNLSEGLKQTPIPICDQPNLMLTKIVSYYSQNMQINHTQHSFMNQKTIMIIMNIVMNTTRRQVILQLIEFMIEEYHKIIEKNQTGQLKDVNYLIEQILSVLHTSILAHKNSVPNNDVLGKICNLVSFHIQRFGGETEGLSILGALATTFNKSFESKASNYWTTIWECLHKTDELPTFKAALSCVGDFARMMESCFFNHSTQVMNLLINYLSQGLDRQIKLQIISCMGDLILSIQQYAVTFINDIIGLFDVCFQAVYEYSQKMTPNDVEYIQELKSNIIQMYSCVLFATNGKKQVPMLVDHFGNLATFVVRTCAKEVRPTVEYLKNCLYLLHDCAAFYWTFNQNHDLIKKVVDSEEIAALVELIKKFDNRLEIKELLDFISARRMA